MSFLKCQHVNEAKTIFSRFRIGDKVMFTYLNRNWKLKQRSIEYKGMILPIFTSRVDPVMEELLKQVLI